MKAAPLGTSLLASTRIGALHVEPSSWCPTWSYAPITSLHKAPLVTHRIGSSILDDVTVGRVFRYVPAPDWLALDSLQVFNTSLTATL